MADHDARLERLERALAVIYVSIRRMLAEAPLPIEIPDLGITALDHVVAMEALQRARGLMADQPMGAEHRLALEAAILEWVTMYELMTPAREFGGDLHLDIAERGAARVTLYLDTVRELTDPGPDEPDES